jgi:hypothetical protein
MKIIAHQAIRMHLPAGFSARCAQGPEKISSIQIIAKNFFAPIASAHQVINGALILNSQLAFGIAKALIQMTNLYQ